MHVACVLIEHLAVKAERRRDSALAGRPVILAWSQRSKQSVMDFSPEAGDLTVGMPLQEALSRCKGVTVLEPDLPRYAEAFERILVALEQRSPVVEDAGLGLAYVDIGGLERLYDGMAGLAKAMLDAAPGFFEAKLGVARAKFPAHVAARAAAPGRAFTVPEDVRGFLAPLPVEVLPVSWKTVTALGRFGLHRLGQIASLPLGPLQAQFGREGETAWGLARGINDRPVLPRITEEVVAESLSFPEPVAQMEALLLGIEALLSRALARSQLRNRYARGATLRVGMYRGAPWMKRVSFREPVADGRRALAVIKDSVAAVELPGPVEEIGLTLWGLTGEAGTQSSMLTEVKRRSDLRGCLRQLESRLGRRPPIYQVREVEPWSRIPERRRALVQLSP